MAHVLIAGMTESGKTTLAKRLIPIYRAQGNPSIVLDVICDPTWDADFQTDNQAEFLQRMTLSRSCALFVDESAEAIGRYAGAMMIVGTRSRHFGHKAHFITQRVQSLDPTIRGQCSELYLFNVSLSDGKMLADEWGKPELKHAHNLAQGEFYKVKRFQAVEKYNLFENKLLTNEEPLNQADNQENENTD